jgi:hypothetical protein
MVTKIPSFNIADIKGRIKELNENKGGGRTYNEDFFPFFNMDIGDEAVVRILPDIDPTNKNRWYVQRFNHKLNIDGREYSTVCPKTFESGADCPICDRADAYFAQNDKPNGLKYWKGKPVANLKVLVLSHGEIKDREGNSLDYTNKVCRVSFTFQVLSALLEQILNFDSTDPVFCGVPEGFNFVLKSTKNGDNRVWSFSHFERRPTTLTNEQVALIEDELVEYSTLLPPRPTIEKLDHMLQASDGLVDLDFSQFSENSDDTKKAAGPKKEPKSPVSEVAPPPAPEPVKADEPPFDTDEDDDSLLVAELSGDEDEDDDVIASILGRDD